VTVQRDLECYWKGREYSERLKALREERQSKITVADSIQGLDERVIIFYSSSVKPPIKNDDEEELEPHCAGWTRF
jgi:hypothetical protein